MLLEEKVTFSDAEKSGLNPAPLYLIVFQLIGAASLEETLLKCPQFAYALQDICIETLGNIAENLGRSNFEMSGVLICICKLVLGFALIFFSTIEKGLMAAVIAAEKIHWAVRLFITQSLTNQAHIVKHKVPVCVKMTLKLDEKLYETFQCQESHSSKFNSHSYELTIT